MQMRKRWGRRERRMFAWEKFLLTWIWLRCSAMFKQEKSLSTAGWLAPLSLYDAATSFKLMWYAHLLHCIEWHVLNAAGVERWRVCVCGGGLLERQTRCVLHLCVCVLFSNAKASSVPPSRVSVVIRSVICTGCDIDAAACWTASGQQDMCVCVCVFVWQGHSYLQSPMIPNNYSNKAVHPFLLTATSGHCLTLPPPVSPICVALLFSLPPLFLSSLSLPLSPYGNHYGRCRFSPEIFLRAFQCSLTLHQPCAPVFLFTLILISYLSLSIFYFSLKHPFNPLYFPTCSVAVNHARKSPLRLVHVPVWHCYFFCFSLIRHI